MDRLHCIVVDDATGERLDGPPTHVLYVEASRAQPSPVYSRHYEGEWVYVDFKHLDWHRTHGHELRLVRVIR